jgi:hypothetical protein
MRPLTTTQIENIETFITNNESCHPPSLAERDIENTKLRYIEIKDQPPHTYYVAGHNANGFTMYKSTDNTIYIFTTYIETLAAYYKVDEDWIKKLEQK